MALVNPITTRLVRGAFVVALATILLLLTKHAQAAEMVTVWNSTPRPLRVVTAPGKLPKSMAWFNLENAEIAPGHAEDVLEATIGAYPKDADGVLVHVMTWNVNATATDPAKQHWTLLDSHLRTLPMTALRTLRHISLVYVTYRRPVGAPVTYTLREEGDEAAQPIQEITDGVTTATTVGLAWGSHAFTVAPGARRVSFLWGNASRAVSKSAAVVNPFRTAEYQRLPARAHMTFDFSSLQNKTAGATDSSASLSAVPSWLLSVAKAANLSGDYSASPTQGLLLAGNGSTYQPVYTLWATAGIGPPNARLYGGLVTETTMVFHDSISNLTWGTSYGAGAGFHMEWPNKN